METLLIILERLAYAIARGVTRAYLDVLKEQTIATKEQSNEEDKARADRIRVAVERMHGIDPTAGDTGRTYPPSAIAGR